ncbi:hypothetical protein JW960_02945 [candidate division KSB1 bacterium]|nr:hypothetical protein [candidate division KSB1 bacterium]
MESISFLNILLNSSIISIVALLLGYYFNRQLAKMKNELGIEEKFIQRKVVVYPNFSEPVYRIRNLLRDFVIDFQLTSELLTRFNIQKDKLVEALFSYRLDLDQNDFDIIHAFKNKSLYALQLIEDLEYYIKKKDQVNINDTKIKIENLYKDIEQGYITIADKLSFSKLKKAE